VAALVAGAAGVAAAKGARGGDRDAIASTTAAYVEQFYPLWLSNAQTQLTPLNQLIGPDRISPIYQSVVAINDDTLYANTPIDLRTDPVDPVILTIPQTDVELSYSVLNLDAFGNAFEPGIPSKPAGLDLPTTVYALVPPGWTGTLPDGVETVELALEFSVLIFRIDKYTNGVDMTTQADAFRRSLLLQPLSGYEQDPNGGATRILPEAAFAIPFKLIADNLIRFAPIRYLRELQEAVHSTKTPPLTPTEQAISDQFDSLFGQGGANVRPPSWIAFAKGARNAHDAIIDNYVGRLGPNNWIHLTNIAAWGPDEALDRASIAEFIQYGNSIATAAYYHTFLDERGRSLRGSTRGGYVLTFPAGEQPPANRFWSLTAYTPNSIELIPNPADKYLVASYTPGLEPNPDGSISIYISPTKPRGVPDANWLPVSSRQFNVMLRIYGVPADSSVADNTYVPPPITRRVGR
jgi:hypothetical protein